jgi:hypothetical protein
VQDRKASLLGSPNHQQSLILVRYCICYVQNRLLWSWSRCLKDDPSKRTRTGPHGRARFDRQHHLRGASSGSRPIPPNPADNGPHESFRNFHPGDRSVEGAWTAQRSFGHRRPVQVVEQRVPREFSRPADSPVARWCGRPGRLPLCQMAEYAFLAPAPVPPSAPMVKVRTWTVRHAEPSPCLV